MKVTGWSTSTPPISASETSASICILPRSFAITNRVGAERLAATVCPTFRSESHGLVDLHATDICFGNERIDLHLAEIIRDHEQGGGRKAGSNGLSHVPI